MPFTAIIGAFLIIYLIFAVFGIIKKEKLLAIPGSAAWSFLYY